MLALRRRQLRRTNATAIKRLSEGRLPGISNHYQPTAKPSVNANSYSWRASRERRGRDSVKQAEILDKRLLFGRDFLSIRLGWNIACSDNSVTIFRTVVR